MPTRPGPRGWDAVCVGRRVEVLHVRGSVAKPPRCCSCKRKTNSSQVWCPSTPYRKHSSTAVSRDHRPTRGPALTEEPVQAPRLHSLPPCKVGGISDFRAIHKNFSLMRSEI